jgi:hypothetical protein
MERMLLALLFALCLASCSPGSVIGQPTGYSDFSMDEFFDIKRTVGSLKVRKSAKALVEARSALKRLKQAAPQKPVFHGQDHYQQIFDDSGKESWFHVGRPVRLFLANASPPRFSTLSAPHKLFESF